MTFSDVWQNNVENSILTKIFVDNLFLIMYSNTIKFEKGDWNSSVVLSGDFNYREITICAIISSKGRKGGFAYGFPLKVFKRDWTRDKGLSIKDVMQRCVCSKEFKSY